MGPGPVLVPRLRSFEEYALLALVGSGSSFKRGGWEGRGGVAYPRYRVGGIPIGRVLSDTEDYVNFSFLFLFFSPFSLRLFDNLERGGVIATKSLYRIRLCLCSR